MLSLLKASVEKNRQEAVRRANRELYSDRGSVHRSRDAGDIVDGLRAAKGREPSYVDLTEEVSVVTALLNMSVPGIPGSDRIRH